MKTNTLKFQAALFILVMGLFQAKAQHPEYFTFEKQEIILPDFKVDGLILDIGGGGEGVIGQLKGDQVISIDLYKDELENAPSTNLKIVMDATDLKFLDNTFEAGAIFYAMMYIPADKHEKVFSELYRTLKPGAILRIWDVNLPMNSDNLKTWGAVYPFTFRLPNKTIETGYGVRWAKTEEQNMDYYIRLVEKLGFKTMNKQEEKPSFYLEFQK
jgi:SAM-dependent methyltransferase